MKKRITRALAALVVGLFLLPLLPTTSVMAETVPYKAGVTISVSGVVIYRQNDSGDAAWNRSWPGVTYDAGTNTLSLKSVNANGISIGTDAEDAAGKELPVSINVRNSGKSYVGSISASGDIAIVGSGMLNGSLYANDAVSIAGVKVTGSRVEANKAVSVNVGSGGSLVVNGLSSMTSSSGNSYLRGGLVMGEGGVLSVIGSAVMQEGTGAWSQPASPAAAKKAPNADVVKAISLRRMLTERTVNVGIDPVTGLPIFKTIRTIADCSKYEYISIEPAARKLEMAKTLTLYPGQSKVLHANVYPEGTASTKVSYTSSKKSVATVDKNTGRVIAVSAGKAKITAKNAQGKKIICTVTVNAKPASGKIPVSDVTLNRDEITLSPRRSYTLKATVYPKKDANVKLTWKSSDPEVATVNSKGKIVAKAEGDCYVYAITQDGGYSDSCHVYVQ